MKTFKELFDEIVNSDELKKAYAAAVKSGETAVEAFLKEHDCDATVEDVRNFFKEQQEASELTEDEIAGVAGGIFLFDEDRTYYSLGPGMCIPNYSRTSDIITRDYKIDLICS